MANVRMIFMEADASGVAAIAEVAGLALGVVIAPKANAIPTVSQNEALGPIHVPTPFALEPGTPMGELQRRIPRKKKKAAMPAKTVEAKRGGADR